MNRAPTLANLCIKSQILAVMLANHDNFLKSQVKNAFFFHHYTIKPPTFGAQKSNDVLVLIILCLSELGPVGLLLHLMTTGFTHSCTPSGFIHISDASNGVAGNNGRRMCLCVQQVNQTSHSVAQGSGRAKADTACVLKTQSQNWHSFYSTLFYKSLKSQHWLSLKGIERESRGCWQLFVKTIYYKEIRGQRN